jgi:NAD(P)-dependent dehydrogenase (short-subunit alcohol dehydrogenase family)
VSDGDHIDAVLAGVKERIGRLDIVVNNAGISPVLQRSERQPVEQWREIIDINLTGAFLAAAAAHELLAQSAGASVVNISSVHARTGHPRLAAYAASKGGMEALTRALATEWAPAGIRVNTIAPGYLETDMTTSLREHERLAAELLERTPLGRFGSAEDVVPAALFLAGDHASYITGATLAVDGGWTAR